MYYNEVVWLSCSSSTPLTRATGSRSTPRPRTCSSTRDSGSDIYEVWRSDPLFYPAIPPAHWLMVSEVSGRVLVVPLALPNSGDQTKCRPIGCYEASPGLAGRYREDR